MKKKLIIISTLTIILSNLPLSFGGGTQVNVPPKTTRHLKQYMQKFGSLVSGLSLLRRKEEKPDWEAIGLTVQEMNQTLQKMKATDKKGDYREFTDELQKDFDQIQLSSQTKNPDIYNQIDNLTTTCFRCHAAHRPADFLKPPPMGNTSRLWEPRSSNP